jgi:hypothetical protein
VASGDGARKVRIEDIELWRNDECFLNGLGAQRIPDPTTAGDFTRRLAPQDTLKLMEAINQARQQVWRKQPKGFLAEAVIDVDGTIAGTLGECKGGIGLSYKGIWGYDPSWSTVPAMPPASKERPNGSTGRLP